MSQTQFKNAPEEMGERTRKAIAKIYLGRLAILKKGLNYSNAGDYKSAVEYYLQYLNILAAYHEVDYRNLSPSNMRDEDPSELFLLSQVYWYMVKIYDRNPKVYGEFKNFLEKFVIFSLGQKFQYVNSEVMRRYIMKGQTNNSSDFINAYKSIKTKKGNCFIATYLYGENHAITENLRKFKSTLNRFTAGKSLVNSYYAISPPLLRIVFRHPRMGEFLTKLFIRPLVYLTYLTWDLKFLKKS